MIAMALALRESSFANGRCARRWAAAGVRRLNRRIVLARPVVEISNQTIVENDAGIDVARGCACARQSQELRGVRKSHDRARGEGGPS